MPETESAEPKPPAPPTRTPASSGASISLSSIDRIPDSAERLRAFATGDPLDRIAAYLASIRRMMIFFTVVLIISIIAAVIFALVIIGTIHSLEQPVNPIPLG